MVDPWLMGSNTHTLPDSQIWALGLPLPALRDAQLYICLPVAMGTDYID